MKKLILTILLFASSNAFAGYYDKIACSGYDSETGVLNQFVLILEREGPNEIFDGQVTPYHMSIYNGIHFSPIHSVKGKVYSEDVYFGFTSDDERIKFELYLDEMEQGELTINGRSYDYVCR